MKEFKMTVYQNVDGNDCSLSVSFQLNEEKAKNMGVIVGTALNSILGKIELQKTLGAKILYLNKPVNFKLEIDGMNANIDSKLLDAGVIGARKEFSASFTVSASPVRQKKFALKVWAATQMMLQELKVVTIQDVIQEKNNAIDLLNASKKVEEQQENKELPENVGNLILTTMPIVAETGGKEEKPRKAKKPRVPRVKKNPKGVNVVENKA